MKLFAEKREALGGSVFANSGRHFGGRLAHRAVENLILIKLVKHIV